MYDMLMILIHNDSFEDRLAAKYHIKKLQPNLQVTLIDYY